MATKPVRVLLVEDEVDYAQAVKELLSTSPSFYIRHAVSFTEAVASLQKETFDVALLDLMLPDNAGLKTYSDLKEGAPGLPIVVVTGMADESLALKAVREGAQDYLVKGQLSGHTLERSIRYAIERRRVLDELNRANEELKAAQLKLVQTEKLEAVGTFAAGVAHEVRNPLQTLLMGLEYLTRHVPAKDKSISSVLNDMVHAVQRADAVVRGLTEFAQHSKREVREEDLSRILSAAVRAVEPELAQQPIMVSQELAEGLPPVVVDFRSLKHVFINLLMRVARELQPEGGRIVARTFASTLEGPLVLNGKALRNFQQGQTVLWAEVEVFPNRLQDAAPQGRPGLTVLRKLIELYSGVMETMYPADTCGTRYVVIFKAAESSGPGCGATARD